MNLAKLRSKIGITASPGKDNSVQRKPVPVTAPAAERQGREIKVMLFADVKNFSQLGDEDAPLFFARFLGMIYDERVWPSVGGAHEASGACA